ncbi:glycosyltransferase family 39 protein, partial [Candidatus Amoebophilus asiaticus]|nr:glycosyltransferase family 39 protein [Candidatus Amoebophilus asiaticus]
MSRTDIYFLAILLIYFFSLYLFNALTRPMSYDESYTYLNFTSKGLDYALTHYPVPNNHVFYSVIAALFDLLPLPPNLTVRLPNVFIGVIAILFFFVFIKDVCNAKIAFVAASLFASTHAVILYSFQGRGYILLTLLTIISTYAIVKIVEKEDTKLLWRVFTISSVLGFFTIPIYLYPFLILCIYSAVLFVLRKEYIKLKQLFISGVLTSVFTVLAYMPIIIHNRGIEVLVSNQGVKTKSLDDVLLVLPYHFKSTCKWLFSLSHNSYWIIYAILLLLVVLVWLIKKKKTRNLYMLCITSFILLPIFLIVQRVVPYPRSWSFMLVFVFLSVALIMDFIVKNISLLRKEQFKKISY